MLRLIKNYLAIDARLKAKQLGTFSFEVHDKFPCNKLKSDSVERRWESTLNTDWNNKFNLTK